MESETVGKGTACLATAYRCLTSEIRLSGDGPVSDTMPHGAPGFFQCESEEKMISANAGPIELHLQISAQSGSCNQIKKQDRQESRPSRRAFLCLSPPTWPPQDTSHSSRSAGPVMGRRKQPSAENCLANPDDRRALFNRPFKISRHPHRQFRQRRSLRCIAKRTVADVA